MYPPSNIFDTYTYFAMKHLAAIGFVIVLAAVAFSQSDAQKKKITNDIVAVMNTQSAAWNRGDIEGFMQGYWNSDKLVFVSSRVTRGWQPTLDNYKRTYPTKEAMGTLTFSDLEVTVLSNDAAVVLGSWSLQRANDNPKGKFTLIFRKFKEGWRIVHDHTT
jgi:ketosteroid isomerase-like protein